MGKGYRRAFSFSLALITCDLLAVVVSYLLAFLIRRWVPIFSPLAHGLDIYLAAWPALIIWPIIFWREGLYPGYWLSVREELRRTVMGTTLAGLVAMSATFVTKTGPEYSRPIVVGGWAISLALIPGFRFVARRILSRLGYAGPRAIILGAGETARILLDGLKRQKPPALRPMALFDDDPHKIGGQIQGVPIVGPISKAIDWAQRHGIRTALVAIPVIPRHKLVPLMEEQGKYFPRLIVIPDLFGVSSAEVATIEIQGILGLEIKNNLLYRSNRIAKRIIDLLFVFATSILILPLLGLLSLAIWLESGRPIFFRHERLGRDGRTFEAWKFRTMVKDSEQVLRSYLEDHPEMRQEWEVTHKLKKDPRLTKVGSILRRMSMDEFPQLINVLKGEMSIVGPRPIVEEEILRYGDRYSLYSQVLPGITGLWQVSGRSDLPYEDRVWLDTHYVRNWSIWLDIVIMVRTVWVVLAGAGAY